MSKNAVSVDIARLLHNNDLGEFGTDLFAMTWEPSKDNQTLIIDSEGMTSDLKTLYEQPSFQILVRGKKKQSPNEVYQSMRRIHEFLITREREIINGTCYLEFEIKSMPYPLGKDENDRFIWSANYYTFRNPT